MLPVEVRAVLPLPWGTAVRWDCSPAPGGRTSPKRACHNAGSLWAPTPQMHGGMGSPPAPSHLLSGKHVRKHGRKHLAPAEAQGRCSRPGTYTGTPWGLRFCRRQPAKGGRCRAGHRAGSAAPPCCACTCTSRGPGGKQSEVRSPAAVPGASLGTGTGRAQSLSWRPEAVLQLHVQSDWYLWVCMSSYHVILFSC